MHSLPIALVGGIAYDSEMAGNELAENWPEQYEQARYLTADTIQVGVIIQSGHTWRLNLHRAYCNMAYATWQEIGS